jgi:nucleoside-diphosphate-sugar epimerase
VTKGGATEATPAVPPPGIYAYSCVAREAMFHYFSRVRGTPGRIIRLNYAIDMRYGVLFDIAQRVHTGTPLDLTMGHVNVIWQGDANEFVLRALAHCTVPTSPLNVSGPPASVRWLAEQFGQRLGKKPVLQGTEAADAWLINPSESVRLFGPPSVPLARLIDWTADWVSRDLPSLGKDTHFDTRDGAY